MNWRIYRLPGSMKVWHIDRGQGTRIINVFGYKINVPSHSVDVENQNPRGWIEVDSHSVLHIIEGIAIWDAVAADVVLPVAEPATVAPLAVRTNCAADT